MVYSLDMLVHIHVLKGFNKVYRLHDLNPNVCFGVVVAVVVVYII